MYAREVVTTGRESEVLAMIKLRRSKRLKETIEEQRIIIEAQEKRLEKQRQYILALRSTNRMLVVKIEDLEGKLEQVKEDLKCEVASRNLERLELINGIKEGRTKVIL